VGAQNGGAQGSTNALCRKLELNTTGMYQAGDAHTRSGGADLGKKSFLFWHVGVVMCYTVQQSAATRALQLVWTSCIMPDVTRA
jgi:hypothetical protein